MIDAIKSFFSFVPDVGEVINEEVYGITKASNFSTGPHYDPIIEFAFTGEQDQGSMSPTRSYIPDYLRLRMKSWQLYYESDIVQIVVNNDLTWVIGNGLNLRAEPKKDILEALGIELDRDEYTRKFEALFSILQKSKNTVHNKACTFDQLVKKARLTKLIGGDVLYVFRYENGGPTMQVIDGCNVQTPLGNETKLIEMGMKPGNRIVHGVELDNKNQQIAYWVKTRKGSDTAKTITESDIVLNPTYTRIQARSESTGLIMAVLGYGSNYRIDEVRGMPVLSATMETANRMDKYGKTTLASAESRENIPYTIEHGKNSDGENPMERQVAEAEGFGLPYTDESQKDLEAEYRTTDQIAQRFAMQTGNTVYNMPIDSHLKSLESKSELYFKDFILTYFGFFCAYMKQPPEVALRSFNSNFSASRMAGKMWEFDIKIMRNDEAQDSYIPFKNLALEVYHRKGVLPNTSEYLQAKRAGWLFEEAFNNCRFVGMQVPHVDPLKEIKAKREELGKAYDNRPLTSPSAVCEDLDLGDFESNMAQFNKDYELAGRPFPTASTNNNGEQDNG